VLTIIQLQVFHNGEITKQGRGDIKYRELRLNYTVLIFVLLLLILYTHYHKIINV